MPGWSEILNELNAEIVAKNPNPFDTVRRKYLARLAAKTNRNTILYATKWTDPSSAPPGYISITEEDVQGFMEVIHGLQGENLDIILHTPGGSPEATEAIVSYLRAKFKNIRVIVPQAAMSAGAMLVCASDMVVLAKHSFLGLVDPQMILNTPFGIRAVPAQAILDQFELAKKECIDPKKLGSWLPILNQYGPALLIECKNALALSKKLTKDWLVKYMFAGEKNAVHKAAKISDLLTAHSHFKSHGRHIDRTQACDIGFNVLDLESDQDVQDITLSVFHATTHTLSGTPAVKIIENHNGRAFIKLQQIPEQLIPRAVHLPNPEEIVLS